MNLENEFILYKESLALKELGFDAPCFGAYRTSGDKSLFYTKEGDLIIEVNADMYASTIKAPLYQQAFKFFRDKGYGLIDKPFCDSMAEIKITYAKDILRWSDGRVWKMKRENSYEEAELECLKKLIEIVKEKK